MAPRNRMAWLAWLITRLSLCFVMAVVAIAVLVGVNIVPRFLENPLSTGWIESVYKDLVTLGMQAAVFILTALFFGFKTDLWLVEQARKGIRKLGFR